MTTTHLLYLHGFRSSPQSAKARLLERHLRSAHPQVTWFCPQLPAEPQAAADLIAAHARDWPTDGMAVIGSSLGGFYATWLAEQRNCRAVLLNPALHPARDLAPSVGELTRWTDPQERFFFHAHYLDQLRALEIGPLRHAHNYLAIIAKGDEVLDWREMVQHYAGARIHLLEGSDHGLSDFPEHLARVTTFLDLATR